MTCNDVALGRDLTPAMAARLLDAVRPDYLQYDCKGHVGYMAYPSQVSRPAANIVNDSLAIQEHPGWAAHRADGTPDPNATSLFGPYPDERMIPQLKEAVDRYNLDGAWIDGECWAVRPDLPIDFVSGDYLGNASISTARLESRSATRRPSNWSRRRRWCWRRAGGSRCTSSRRGPGGWTNGSSR